MLRRPSVPGSGIGAYAYHGKAARLIDPHPREGWRAQYTTGEMFDCLAANDFELVEGLTSPHVSHTNSSVAIFRR